VSEVEALETDAERRPVLVLAPGGEPQRGVRQPDVEALERDLARGYARREDRLLHALVPDRERLGPEGERAGRVVDRPAHAQLAPRPPLRLETGQRRPGSEVVDREVAREAHDGHVAEVGAPAERDPVAVPAELEELDGRARLGGVGAEVEVADGRPVHGEAATLGLDPDRPRVVTELEAPPSREASRDRPIRELLEAESGEVGHRPLEDEVRRPGRAGGAAEVHVAEALAHGEIDPHALEGALRHERDVAHAPAVRDDAADAQVGPDLAVEVRRPHLRERDRPAEPLDRDARLLEQRGDGSGRTVLRDVELS
jgi:hypothetical protein